MTQRFPDLRGLQSLFWQLLSAPEGVKQGAADLRAAGLLESEELDFFVRSDARLAAADRLDIYADMYFYRLRDCLAEDYPKVAALVGADRFHNLVTDYLLAHPSTHFSLRELGRALPGFLDAHPLQGEFPIVADLARLEWARVDVFDGADAAALSRSELVALGGSASAELVLALVPSARLLRLDAGVLPLWRRLDGGDPEAGEESGKAPGEKRGVRVWRKGFAVLHRSLPADEEHCLRVLAADGATLPRLGERLLEGRADAPPEQVARRLAELLGLWAGDELVRLRPRAA